MVKIALIGLVGMILAVVLKDKKPEYASYISIATGIWIVCIAVALLEQILGALSGIQALLDIPQEYLSVLLKMVGIAYLAEFASNLCKDAGQSAISGQIEFAAKLSMLVISLPVLQSVVESIREFLV